MDYEARISAAIAELGKQDVPNFAATARKHKINRITLARRFRGESQPAGVANLNLQGRLTANQEQDLIAWIGELSARKLPPTPGMIKIHVERLIGEEISSHWVPNFFKRNKIRLKGKYLPGLDANRVYATATQECFQIWFENFKLIQERYRFKPDQIINFDEKGFLIGRIRKSKRIFTVESGCIGVKQDGSREWISIKAAITASGRVLSPGVIFQSQSGLVREHWISDWEVTGGFRAAVAATESGWTNAELAVQFLEEVIDKETRQNGSGYRLLLLDGHSTHLTLPFLEACDRARIILALIPAHSTHLMQPLDVGCFGPLSHAYSQALERWQSNLPLASSLTKSDFWRLFETARKEAFTKKNIISAFTAAGIWPWCPKKVLDKVPQTRKAEKKAELTLSGQLRQIYRETRRDRDQIWRDPRIKVLLNCLERASVELECIKHDNAQLRASIARQKTKTATSKQLQHPDLPNLGKGCFFTPSKIQKAREWEQDKANKAEADAAAKAQRLVDMALKKAAKEAEIERKRAALTEKRRIGKEKREKEAQERAERKAEREARITANKKAKEEAKKAREALKKPLRRTIKNLKKIRNDLLAAQQAQDLEEEERINIDEAPKVARNGRIIRKPARFRPNGC